MNQQLRIIYNPQTQSKTVESPILERRFTPAQELISITSALAWVYDRDVLLYSADLGGGTIINTNEELSIIWDSPTQAKLIDKLKTNYKVIWQINGTEQVERWFDVVLWRLLNPISEIDIMFEKAELDPYRPERKLLINSIAASDQFVCNQLIEPSDFWNGSVMQLNDKLAGYEVRRVIDWDFSSQTLTIETPFTIDPQVNTYFTLRRGYYPEIKSAWDEIHSMVHSWVGVTSKRKGIDVAVDGYDFRQVHLYLTIIKICSTLRDKDKDRFDSWLQYYQSMYGKATNELRVKVDADLKGIPQDHMRTGQIWQQL